MGVLQNGEEIAVKRLSKDSSQGNTEFKAEIERLAVLKHKNLIELRGYCLEMGEESLVYELAVNMSLSDHLFASKEKREALKWANRFEIIKGIAVGLQHLHTGTTTPTVHRDLKAANVLLDKKMNPKIADFGLARKCDPDQTYGMTRNAMGTDGYLAPEYIRCNGERFSTKTDVYAFGVLVLEIISGKRVNSITKFNPNEPGVNLVSYAWMSRDDKNLTLIDPLLKNSVSNDEEVEKCTKLGLSCVQEDSNLRPDMPRILEFLNYKAESADLPTPRCPEYVYYGGPDPSTTLSSALSGAPTSATISSSDNSNFGNGR